MTTTEILGTQAGEAIERRAAAFLLQELSPAEAARLELDKLLPHGDEEALRCYNVSMAAYIGGRATAEQRNHVARIESLKEAANMPHDIPRTSPAPERFI